MITNRALTVLFMEYELPYLYRSIRKLSVFKLKGEFESGLIVKINANCTIRAKRQLFTVQDYGNKTS